MTLAQFQTYVYRATQTTATSFPVADQLIEFNNAYEQVNARIRKYLDNYRPTLWSASDLTTGTLTPVFDSLFHELIPLYASIDRATERNLPSVAGLINRRARLEAELDEWYGLRNYEVFSVTIAAPGVLTKNNHGLVTNDRVTLITSSALPTGLSADTFYYVIYITDHTFELSATRDGSAITTTGSQSGTHYYASDRPKRMKAAVETNR